MKYLKVFTDFAKSIEMLSDAEKGRLFYAMLTYAETGEEPNLNGNERFVWPTAKMNIDRQEKSYQNKANAAAIARQSNPNNCSDAKQTDISPEQNCSELKTVQDKDKDNDKDKEINKKKYTFVRPTLEEVMAYCQERHNGIDAGSFIDFYESKGWKIGKESMKDWKAAVRTWERRHNDAGAGKQPGTSGSTPKVQSKYEGRNFYDNV